MTEVECCYSPEECIYSVKRIVEVRKGATYEYYQCIKCFIKLVRETDGNISCNYKEAQSADGMNYE